jgi:F-type H+-transporting ATPase subunit a
VTGNLGVTLVLAFFVMIITNFSGNKHYWQHIFWMPGVPTPVRFILAPVELAGIFIKPFTLLIRLFANITAGHVIILCLVGLVFILGENGKNIGGAAAGGTIAVLFMFMMNLLELLVAFIQAFIFALLSSLYIGMAIEEHHHEEAH